jgi:hypothetical protein
MTYVIYIHCSKTQYQKIGFFLHVCRSLVLALSAFFFCFFMTLFVPSCANSQKIQSLLNGYQRTSSFSMCCASATFSFDLLTLDCFSDMKSMAAESVCRVGINLITSLVSGGGTPLSPSNSVRCSEVPYVVLSHRSAGGNGS